MTPLSPAEYVALGRIKPLLDATHPAVSSLFFGIIDRLAGEINRMNTLIACLSGELRDATSQLPAKPQESWGDAAIRIQREARVAEQLAEAHGAEISRLRGELSQWIQLALAGKPESEAEQELTKGKEESP